MSKEKAPKLKKERTPERISRFFRNINALGAVAFFGAGVIAPVGALAFNTLAAVNAVQAVGFEAARKHFRKRSLKKAVK